MLGATAATAAAVCCGTVTHPYLLADNRHYTFYLWKDILGPLGAWRAALAPAYAASGLALFGALAAARGGLWALALTACTAAAIVPAGLLELRYFTVPAFLAVLHLPPAPRGRVLAQCAAFAAVDAATLYLFTQRPFLWPDGSTARFMW
jgi:alpha-1,2-glucosyltransferase